MRVLKIMISINGPSQSDHDSSTFSTFKSLYLFKLLSSLQTYGGLAQSCITNVVPNYIKHTHGNNFIFQIGITLSDCTLNKGHVFKFKLNLIQLTIVLHLI